MISIYSPGIFGCHWFLPPTWFFLLLCFTTVACTASLYGRDQADLCYLETVPCMHLSIFGNVRVYPDTLRLVFGFWFCCRLPIHFLQISTPSLSADYYLPMKISHLVIWRRITFLRARSNLPSFSLDPPVWIITPCIAVHNVRIFSSSPGLPLVPLNSSPLKHNHCPLPVSFPSSCRLWTILYLILIGRE